MFRSHSRTQTISRYQREQERERKRARGEIKAEFTPGELAGDCSQDSSQTPVINKLSGIEHLKAMHPKSLICCWMWRNATSFEETDKLDVWDICAALSLQDLMLTSFRSVFLFDKAAVTEPPLVMLESVSSKKENAHEICSTGPCE